jgi:hypothetical protein
MTTLKNNILARNEILQQKPRAYNVLKSDWQHYILW